MKLQRCFVDYRRHPGFSWALGDVQWHGNVFESVPRTYTFINLSQLLGLFFCPHGVIVARNTDEVVTGPSDAGVFSLQSPETRSLHSADLHLSYWLELCWIKSVSFKGAWFMHILTLTSEDFFFFQYTFGQKSQIILTIPFIKAIKGGKYPNRGDLLFMGSVFLQPLSHWSKSFVEILQQKL